MSRLNYTFTNEQMLYSAYMPFVEGGGLFIRVKPNETMTMMLGDKVELELTLPNDAMLHQVSGKVVWVTPIGAQGGKPPGYGVALVGEGAVNLKSKILKQISSLLKVAGLPTDTM